jgi:hypothetical protein
MRSLKRQHAYFEVGSTTKPRQLFSSVLSQLHALKRNQDKAYAGQACDTITDFMVEVASAFKWCCILMATRNKLSLCPVSCCVSG